MWADNVKFVKDIIDSKYQKIDAAAAEVDQYNKIFDTVNQMFFIIKINESSEVLLKDAACAKSKEHFNSGLRTLELVQPTEIETLLETIISVSFLIFLVFEMIPQNSLQDLNGKEKDMLENELKEKIGNRTAALEKAKQIKEKLKI